MTARFRLALWALTLTLALAANAVQAKTPLVARATCLAQCGGMITSQCTKTLKNGKTKIKPACKAKIIRQCRHNKLVCPTVSSSTTTTTLPPGGCPQREPATLPYQLNLMVPVADPTTNSNGSDLDNGTSGLSHNFPVIGGNVVKYCLSGCDGTTTTQCTGTGTTGGPAGAAKNTLNGPDFGAPLPLLAAGVPVCVVSRYQDPQITSTYDLATGQGSGLIKLFSDVYLVQSSQEVCPRCLVPGGGGTLGDKGTCSGTATTPGVACTVEALDKVTQGAGNQNYTLSTSCIPTANLRQASLDIELPLTTETATSAPGPLPCKSLGQTSDDACGGGTCNAGCTGNACVTHDASGNCIDAKGGISQLCCSSNTSLPCFPTANGGAITRQGKRALDGQLGAQVATFCIANTASTVINTTTGLPGPGAIILPNQVQVLRGQ
jgi:hypothetical protein